MIYNNAYGANYNVVLNAELNCFPFIYLIQLFYSNTQ